MTLHIPRLKMLPATRYKGVKEMDPIRFYSWPVIGTLYRRRIELCLAECTGGDCVLEVGFGSGVTFLNLGDMYRHIYGIDLTAAADDVQAMFRSLGVATHLQKGNVLHLPYADGFFDTVLLISILEHLKPEQQRNVFQEISRVLKPGGQVVYGVPIEGPLMVLTFRLLGYNIREHHFSTEQDVSTAASQVLSCVRMVQMHCSLSRLGPVYEVGHFVKPGAVSR